MTFRQNEIGDGPGEPRARFTRYFPRRKAVRKVAVRQTVSWPEQLADAIREGVVESRETVSTANAHVWTVREASCLAQKVTNKQRDRRDASDDEFQP